MRILGRQLWIKGICAQVGVSVPGIVGGRIKGIVLYVNGVSSFSYPGKLIKNTENDKRCLPISKGGFPQPGMSSEQVFRPAGRRISF
jgi:hypothetical protein